MARATVLAILALLLPQGALAETVKEVPTSAAEITLSFAPVVKRAAPSVVNLKLGEGAADAIDPRQPRFFGNPQAPAAAKTGSGVIVDPSGLLVTSAHVLGNAREVQVAFNDRREFNATLLLKDERTDLAVLRIEGEGPFPAISFSDHNELEVGDIVLAIGNPYGVGQTVTQGIVSATARTQVGVSDYRFFIQTDAAINPGNSGGALIDMAGRLVGINTAIFSRGAGGSIGIGFAIPSDMVRVVVNSAAEGRAVLRPWFGARLQTMTRELATQYGLDRPTGALVVQLVDDSPALQSGLRVGDIIVAVDGEPVQDHDTFGYLFATRGLGGTARVEALRGGETTAFDVALTPPPETVDRDARRIGGRSPFAGSIAMNLSPKVADELSLQLSSEGVALARVDPRSIAARVGLKKGDIILEVNGLPIEDTRALARVARKRILFWDIVLERNGEKLSLILGG